jgi:hypothetical protein
MHLTQSNKFMKERLDSLRAQVGAKERSYSEKVGKLEADYGREVAKLKRAI